MASSEAAATVAAARAGDEAAFAELVEPYRRELQVHCYRMLGSLEDAEDLVQETFLRAWRGRGSFQGRSSFRAWLYRIATNACLDALERRPRVAAVHEGAQPTAEIPWLQPYPDQLLEDVAAGDAAQEERALLERYMEASEDGDSAAMVELLREDAFFAMPPEREWVVGGKRIVDAWVQGGFGDEAWGKLRCVLAGANAQPAVAFYAKRAGDTED